MKDIRLTEFDAMPAVLYAKFQENCEPGFCIKPEISFWPIFGRRIQNSEGSQESGARSQKESRIQNPKFRIQKRNSGVRCQEAVIRTREIGSCQHP